MTFIVPYDFTDNPNPDRKTDQDRWDDAITSWKTDIDGALRLTFGVIRAGDVLELLAREEHAGRRMFWFGQLELTEQWLNDRWQDTRTVVGERYTPEAHTPSEIESDIAATVLSPDFTTALQKHAKALIAASEDDLGALGDQAQAVADRVRDLRNWLAESFDSPDSEDGYARIANLASVSLGDAAGPARELLQIVENRREKAKSSPAGRNVANVRESLLAFLGLTAGRRARYSSSRALAVSGPAGQGKTHLLVHTARRLLDQGGLAIVLPGIRFQAGPWWTEMSGILGGVPATSDQFFAALDSLAEARGHRAVVIVDALNESQSPQSWNAELPSLFSTLMRYPNLALLVSIRSDYLQLITLGPEIPIINHPGFAGAETEALANYCALFKIPVPSTSIFDPAYGNPLFLRMYCEVRSSGTELDPSTITRSNLFDRFTVARGRQVLSSLELSPASDAVAEAMTLMADLLIATAGRPVPRAECEAAVNSLVPHRTAWPKTLFAVLLSEGLLEVSPLGEGPSEVVGLPFQAYSEHVVVNRLLSNLESTHAQLPNRNGFLWLRRRPQLIGFIAAELATRRRFWRAAAVLIPERYGHELIDILPTAARGFALEEVTRESLIERRANAFGTRAFELFEQFLASDTTGIAADLTLALAPRPNHPANGHWLHERLCDQTMPDRDATWGIATFDAEEESGALRRIFSWVDAGDQHADAEYALLVGIPLMWLLTSPNRFLRDRVTKALVELFRHRLATLAELLTLARETDDVYLQERAITATYGAVMRGGDTDHGGVQMVMSVLNAWRQGALPINDLARDSARGVAAWAHDRSIIDSAEYGAFTPPYGAGAPTEPPSREELEAEYGWDADSPEEDAPWRAQSILSSCLDWLGDFNRYVMQAAVESFSLHPLSGPPPAAREPEDSLEETAGDVFGEVDEDFLRGFDEDRLEVVPKDPLEEVDSEWAGRWVANRAISLGWTPERFGDFERSRSLSSSTPHKAERFGKKYQWVAHHELLARLADNFHPSLKPWHEAAPSYEGPWEWSGRDIDPSLISTVAADGRRVSPVTESASDDWILLREPDIDPSVAGTVWVPRKDDLPQATELFAPQNPDGTNWVALQRYSEWHRSDSRRTITSQRVRDLFLLQFSWLVPAGTGERVFEFVVEERLKDRWMDGAHKHTHQYLGEGNWARIASTPRPPDTPTRLLQKGFQTRPATEEYHCEGVSYDCSIDENLNFHTPTDELAGTARWSGGGRAEWVHDDRIVCRTLSVRDQAGREHDALIAEQDWLEKRLTELDAELLIGTLGHKQAASDSSEDPRAMSWSDITYVGLLVPGQLLRAVGPLLRVQRLT